MNRPEERVIESRRVYNGQVLSLRIDAVERG